MRFPPLKKLHRLPRFLLDFATFKRAAAESGARLPKLRDTRAMVEDATPGTGFDAQYVYHCGWAARELARRLARAHARRALGGGAGTPGRRQALAQQLLFSPAGMCVKIFRKLFERRLFGTKAPRGSSSALIWDLILESSTCF